MRRLILLLAAGSLSSCATRGTLDVDCSNLELSKIETSTLITDIQSGNDTDPMSAGKVVITPDERATRRFTINGAPDPSSPMLIAMSDPGSVEGGKPKPHLLLSGGGQWGAYGTGFLAMLHDKGKLPSFGTVTGVSTGALQSLFIGALGDRGLRRLSAKDRKLAEGEIFKAMMRAYRPAAEDEIVNRSAQIFSIATGSFAGLSPLRGRLLRTLCDKVVNPTDCPVIKMLSQSDTHVFIGFVKAADGNFYFSDINEIAKNAYDGPDGGNSRKLGEAQRCIAGAAMASLAMPVFFQQVRVAEDGKPMTYFDGGVRQSVFEVATASTLVKATKARNVGKSLTAADVPALYVLRNGPTVLLKTIGKDGKDDSGKYNKKRNIINSALRAEQILVNQLEVQSIADLRLANPYGDIWLRTADGFANGHDTPGDDPLLPELPWYQAATRNEICKKEPFEAMFSPSFMACLMRFGRAHADGSANPAKPAAPWIKLSVLDPTK